MIVIKRDGREQEFAQRKICTSILNASDEIGQSMNRSDVKTVSAPIEKAVSDEFNGTIHAADLHKLVVKALNDLGFPAVAEAYDAKHSKI